MRVSTSLLLVTACCVAGCHRPAPERSLASASDAAAAAEAVPVRAPAPAPATYASTPSLTPPPSDTPTDEFAGWYFEKGGTGMLVGCGQAMPLEVADPAFLHQLNGRRGGATAPVYVRLAVRPAGGSKLEVVKIEQFGVDEGPAPDCALDLAP